MLTDNEIITALQVFCEQDNDMLLTKSVAKEILDLIKRQKTEIDILIRKKETLQDEIAEQQAEIEKLQKVIFKKEDNTQIFHKEHQETVDELQFAKAEIEKYTTNFARVAKLIKSEARKEFAKRLKEHKHECGCNYRKKPVYAVTEEKIDNLLEEMERERE